MRTTQDYRERHLTLTFDEDGPNGEYFTFCPCGARFDCTDKDVCPECKKELVYPGWASW